jgi:hypothetical protein
MPMLQPMNQDPDDNLVALFKQQSVPNPTKTLAEGRPVFDDMEVVEIRRPGSKDYGVYPATAVSHWKDDPFTGGQTQITYAERFRRQYQQFKAQASQTKSGTPLDYAPFLSEGRRAELRAQNIYVVEQLAAVEGAELKNLGPGGRDMKNAALEYIEQSKGTALNMQMMAELEALKARNSILEEDYERRKQKELEAKVAHDSEFDAMSLDQLREYITVQSGQAPLGSLNRKNLVRMAENCRPDKVA